MYTVYFIINQSCQRKLVKELHKITPNTCVSKFTHAFIIEAIRLCYRTALVISAQKSDMVRIVDLDANEQLDSLHTKITAIHIVAQEKVTASRWSLSHIKHVAHIIKLTV